MVARFNTAKSSRSQQSGHFILQHVLPRQLAVAGQSADEAAAGGVDVYDEETAVRLQHAIQFQ
jgi:hypothetical protein